MSQKLVEHQLFKYYFLSIILQLTLPKLIKFYVTFRKQEAVIE